MSDLTISETAYSDDDFPDAGPGQSVPGKLVVSSGPDQGQSIIVEGRVLSIGTLPENDFVLSDKTVSRRHAEVVAVQNRFMIRDLGSTNGTIVNGRKVKEAMLDFGATIKLGYTQLNYLPCRQQPAAAFADEAVFGKVSARSAKMRSIFSMLERIAPTDATIIIEGETGTGKEMLASAIHDKSLRAGHPFVVFDCRAIANIMIESELFGHERGAFAGAATTRPGVFELAQGGTIFLDEICELDMEMQPKLLRVLENYEVRRMGGTDNIRVDARIIASSSRDLDLLIDEGRFRKDLFYRLSVHHIILPPLRERPDDIPLLAAALMKKLAAEYKMSSPPRIAPETFEILKAHDWPGNVRELRNVLSRALSLGSRTMLRPEDLMLRPADDQRKSGGPPLADVPLQQIEKIAIEQTLISHGGDLAQSAKALGITRSVLLEKLRRHGIS